MTFPRRIQMEKWVPAERAIYDAVQVVEGMGADVRLTDAVCLLGAARDRVADFVDAVEGRRTLPASASLPVETTGTDRLDDETERLISEFRYCALSDTCVDDLSPHTEDALNALRARIRVLVEEARNEHIGTMTHVDYDDD